MCHNFTIRVFVVLLHCGMNTYIVFIDNVTDFATSEKYLFNTEMTLGESSEDDSDLFRILISSDIHLGYAEKDAERGLDSFNSFDELLGIGVERGVDMVTCFDDDECCLEKCVMISNDDGD